MSDFFTRKEYETKEQKRTDFIIGAVAWFVLNVILAALPFAPTFFTAPIDGESPLTDDVMTVLYLICSLAPWVINLGVIIVLAITRRWIALGMLAAIGAAMELVICLGVILIGACSTGLLGNSL